MSKSSLEICELEIGDLDTVSGGMPFYGMNCSKNGNELIGAIDDALGSIPVIGGALSGAVTAIGRIICG